MEEPPDERSGVGMGPPLALWSAGLPAFPALPARVDRISAVVEPPNHIPEPEQEVLPEDSESDAWLEFLRDGFCKQLREENECDEPPIFNRAMHFASEPGQPCSRGRYPRASLNSQLKLLLQFRAGGDAPGILFPKLGTVTAEMLKARQVAPPPSRSGLGQKVTFQTLSTGTRMAMSPSMVQQALQSNSVAGRGVTVAPPAHMGVNRTIVK
eukprot:TRINITY_DN94141_c0_g1_i1.p1 TRINITY_DN94141_c0_g1~~TRINITY_DN94141_c0_g1_i1.p1  ORF type:complete len:211 (-),score=27.18 TRINITY_DN94141_c0_g1_i1:33-665(-)